MSTPKVRARAMERMSRERGLAMRLFHTPTGDMGMSQKSGSSSTSIFCSTQSRMAWALPRKLF